MAVCAAFVAWATRGTQTPTHHEVRLAAGDPTKDGRPRGLTSAECMRAYRTFGVDAERYYGASYAIAREAIRNGHGVHAAVDYPTINSELPAMSGDPNFRGGHAVALIGPWTVKDQRAGGRNSCLVGDPLFDGRRPSIPRLGLHVVPFPIYRAALGNFRAGGAPIGRDRGVFIVVRQAALQQAAETPEQVIARLDDENRRLRDALADIDRAAKEALEQ